MQNLVFDPSGCSGCLYGTLFLREHRALLHGGLIWDAVVESLNDWGARECHKFVPVLGGDGTKTIPPQDLFDQPPGKMS